jgi:segregation and condensation protein A
MDDAIKRLTGFLRRQVDWGLLSSFLPPDCGGGIRGRSALAATLAASLELVRAGRAEIRQDRAFGPVFVRRSSGEA